MYSLQTDVKEMCGPRAWMDTLAGLQSIRVTFTSFTSDNIAHHESSPRLTNSKCTWWRLCLWTVHFYHQEGPGLRECVTHQPSLTAISFKWRLGIKDHGTPRNLLESSLDLWCLTRKYLRIYFPKPTVQTEKWNTKYHQTDNFLSSTNML